MCSECKVDFKIREVNLATSCVSDSEPQEYITGFSIRLLTKTSYCFYYFG